MIEKTYDTPLGPIRYWVNGLRDDSGPSLALLPGLTADHRLFDRQVERFIDKYPLLVWDPPGHAASWPFELTFSLMDVARWLDGMLAAEGFHNIVIAGQSMGGYVGQAYAQCFPEKLKGYIAIDSAPLQRQTVTAAELWMLKRMEPVYRHYPWRWLKKSGPDGVAVTPYGRALMREMMSVYDGDQERYARLAGHGFRMLAEAFEADLPYALPCPALLICGVHDRAGSCRRCNRAWERRTGIPVHWIEHAGHNSNTDAPEAVNALIESFMDGAARSLRDGPTQ